MKAFVCHALSEDLSGASLAETASPAARAGEVSIAVKAAGVNFPDYLMCQGKYQFKPAPPFIPGMEVCGTIEALGEGVSGFAPGDWVVTGARLGGFAEVVTAPAALVQPKPAGLSAEQASAYHGAYITAYVALVRRARVQAGETILVHGAAGGVGLACVDLARQFGARVIATASTPEKRAFLHAYGVCDVLPASGFTDAVKDLTNGAGADVVFDPVGGDVFDESVRCIAFDGRLLVIGFTSGRIASINTNMPLIKGFSVVGVRAGEYGRQFPDRGRADSDALWRLAQDGALNVHIGARFSLDEAKDALLTLGQRRAIGKVVICP